MTARLCGAELTFEAVQAVRTLSSLSTIQPVLEEVLSYVLGAAPTAEAATRLASATKLDATAVGPLAASSSVGAVALAELTLAELAFAELTLAERLSATRAVARCASSAGTALRCDSFCSRSHRADGPVPSSCNRCVLLP